MNKRRVRRWGEGKASAVRRLYSADHPLTQVALSVSAGVSQPAISQYLRSLRDEGHVSFEDPGWLPNRTTLAGAYLEGYSSRFATQRCWYRIDSAIDQAMAVVDRVPSMIVSGDVAADLVRAWRHPTVAVVYGPISDEAMESMGFVEADSAASASVLVRPVPGDRFAADTEEAGGLRVPARVHLVADVIGLGGDDRLEAAERLALVDQ